MATLNISTPQINKELISAKLSNLRSLLINNQFDAYFIPAVDEHLNVSMPAAKQRRAWISGFTGSAGDLLVGTQQSWLFVDSRYHEQAELQIDSSLINISKLGKEGNLTLLETLENLAQTAAKNNTIFRLAFDPFTLAFDQFQSWENRLSPLGVTLVPVAENLVDIIRSQSPWSESDPIPAYGESPLFSLPSELTGETTQQKLARVREAMQQVDTNILPITNLNQVAWLFNLRGADIPYIPLFISYAVITLEQAFLFTNLSRIDAELKQTLQINVTLKTYEQYGEVLKDLVSQSPNPKILLDPKHTTMGTYGLIVSAAKEEIDLMLIANPIELMKARKNAVEIEQMKTANFKASRAKTRTLKWLADELASGKVVSELDVKEAIERFYEQETDFQSLTFRTIAATGANGSIVHYSTPSRSEILKQGSLLLLDSGAQYKAGTTDDTRTMSVGEPTQKQIERYTAVLIAHINCAMQQFPKGTTGMQIDAIARSPLWLLKLDYGHGTGHGVGAFLSGHEGPNGISKLAQQPLEPGMITSIEPGYYEPGWGGIRLENLYVVQDNGAAWYSFEPLTYIPFEKKLIDLNRLSTQQREWLQKYNQAVVHKLTSTLDSAEAEWLKEACSF
jgi:Xaa-Pro aminopeptidase